MKKDTINLATIEVAKVWQPTMMLRNVERVISSSNYHCEKVLFLQQMWTSNLGDIEWKDIPIENEMQH
jgi:hypothetical protein